MTVKELKEKLAALPSSYDGYEVVSMRPLTQVKMTAEGETFEFAGFDDVEMRRLEVSNSDKKVRID